MDIAEKVKMIDAEIASRTSRNFGIMMGRQLFLDLARIGKIKKTQFGVMGSETLQNGVARL